MLRPYQIQLKSDIYDAWANGFKNILAVLPTGGGKTIVFCDIAVDQAINLNHPTAIQVHRKELVQQICLTLSSLNISHNIIAQRSTILGIISAERRLYGKQFYNHKSPISVVSVDTLNARINRHMMWAKSIEFWIVDEAAHVLTKNKWGRSLKYFPNAKGLGVTATPQRLDKRGLGSHADGVFDTMVMGPTTRWLIDEGYLCPYKIAISPSDYRNHLANAKEGHDFTRVAMARASEKSKIVGDVVEHYQKLAAGKQAIVFADSIAAGERMESEFIRKGVSAKLLTGLTPDNERLEGMINFRDKDTQVLINVDLFDEGLDVPGIECVIMARPTMSVSKFLQMCGRGLRPLAGKDHLILIDHVGNINTHRLPDEIRHWTLDRIVKRRDKVNLIRICKNPMCNAPYDRLLHICPYCGLEDEPPTRGSGEGRIPLELVDGDLVLLDPESLRKLDAGTMLEDPALLAERVSKAAGGAAGVRAMRNQRERIEVQEKLGEYIARWAGKMKRMGYTDRQIHKHFYIHRGMTITQAMSEPKAGMLDTMGRSDEL